MLRNRGTISCVLPLWWTSNAFVLSLFLCTTHDEWGDEDNERTSTTGNDATHSRHDQYAKPRTCRPEMALESCRYKATTNEATRFPCECWFWWIRFSSFIGEQGSLYVWVIEDESRRNELTPNIGCFKPVEGVPGVFHPAFNVGIRMGNLNYGQKRAMTAASSKL